MDWHNSGFLSIFQIQILSSYLLHKNLTFPHEHSDVHVQAPKFSLAYTTVSLGILAFLDIWLKAMWHYKKVLHYIAPFPQQCITRDKLCLKNPYTTETEMPINFAILWWGITDCCRSFGKFTLIQPTIVVVRAELYWVHSTVEYIRINL